MPNPETANTHALLSAAGFFYRGGDRWLGDGFLTETKNRSGFLIDIVQDLFFSAQDTLAFVSHSLTPHGIATA